MLWRFFLMTMVFMLLGGCGRWAIERQDARAAELIDARLPAGMTLQEFGKAFPAAQPVEASDDVTAYLATAQEICFWCRSGQGFVRSTDSFARVVIFEDGILVRIEPARARDHQ